MAGAAAWNEDEARAILAGFRGVEGATLPMLHALQEAFGCIPEAAVPLVASTLNLSRAEVHGIVTFYHDFCRTPPGRHALKLCRAEACQSMGGERLAETAQARLGVSWGETSADGAVTLEPVFCLGLCAVAPAGMVDGRLVGRLKPERLDEILAEAKFGGAKR